MGVVGCSFIDFKKVLKQPSTKPALLFFVFSIRPYKEKFKIKWSQIILFCNAL
jgi:hypothetical protein